MKCPLGISNFLEEISSLPHSIVFLYFFALITEEGFLISPCYSLELCIQKTKIRASGPLTSWEIDGETVETVSDFIFGASKSLQMMIAAMKLKDAYSLEGKL